ncbi:MAG TPA: M14 metallopeptidase family protein, partial [Vicinamibacteria bacterium]|nr:M14 metallopeptidase family protein [Vicinamibacteria bacterium]
DPGVPTFEKVFSHAPGERILSHAQILAYVDALAAAKPERMRVFEYARTWEGRKLVYAMIGSEANMARLEEIRANRKRLAEPRKTSEADARALIESEPAITWLAYGVHGNEISSPDAGLLTAYHLLASVGDPMVDQILAETLVVIVPTQNPDGRDRFVHQFDVAYGIEPAAHPLAAEHDEPWPGGRTNHYYFDLNRDWLTLTQPETQGHVAAYFEWFPQIFVDLHEMGGNSTYYFAPEAVPYNPHITSQQREALEIFGRNNARWFDRYGFRYFTREVYDAFYPGYGASWPLFHGSIATTYEQASARGLVFRRSDGTDLRFRDGVRHHFVASLSTAETVARERRRLLEGFWQYRKTAVEEGRTEAVKAYVLANEGDTTAVRKAAGILVEHGIEVSRSRSSVRGCGGREAPAGSYVIDLAQPAKRLIRTLLDADTPLEADFLAEQERRRRKKLPDEIYDVTGWSIPQIFNIEALACDTVPSGERDPAGPDRIEPGRIEGRAQLSYLVPWGTQAAARLLAAALREDLRVLSSDREIRQSGAAYPTGTLLFMVADNPPELHETLERLARETGARVVATETGWVDAGVNFGSANVRHVRKPRVAMAWDLPTSSSSAGATRFVLERQYGYPVTPIRSRRIAGADLRAFDVLILPEGDYAGTFGDEGKANLQSWVRGGGTLIGIGEAVSYLASSGFLDSKRENQPYPEKASEEKEDKPPAMILATEEDYLKAIEPAEERPDAVAGVVVRARLDPEHWLNAGMG